MKIRTAGSLFLLSVLVAGMAAAAPSEAFAADPKAVLEPLPGSSIAGCQDADGGCYNHLVLTVSPGTTIIFMNTDNAAHTLTGGSLPDGPSGTFDSGLVTAGASYEFTLDEEGTYDHFCIVHPWMTGQIVVDASAAAEDDGQGTGDGGTAATAGDDAGGCLVATAAFGSELAPQVQQLRELRDNTVLATESGAAFMSGFNTVYYAFSPAVADLERENPAFREAVKVVLTPMLASLSLLNHADIDTEYEMLGYGTAVILLNLGMYVGIPAFASIRCAKLIRARLHG